MKHIFAVAILLSFFGQSAAQFPRKWFHLQGPNIGSHDAQLLYGPNGEIISVGKTGYYQTADEGLNWQYHKVIPDIPCIQHSASGLLISTSGEYYFYFGTYSGSNNSCDASDSSLNGVYISTDNGNTWRHAIIGTPVVQLTEAGNHTIYAAAFETAQYSYSIYESIDKGKSWVSITTLNDVPGFCGSTDSYLYYYLKNTSPGFVFRIPLLGGAVQDFRSGMQTGHINSILQIRKNLFMAAGYNGQNKNTTFYTSDGESQWVSGDITLPGLITIYKGNGDTVYSAVQSADNKKSSILYTTNFGNHWEYWADLPSVNAGSLNSINSSAMLYENDSALYISMNKGNSWKEIGLPYDTITKIIVSGDSRIFVERLDQFYSNYRATYGAQSSDNGKNWQGITPAGKAITGLGKGINGDVISIAPDSNELWNFVWLYDSSTQSQWIKRSVFQDLPDHSFIASDNTKEIYCSKQSTSSDPFLYRSDDTAFTWTALDVLNDGEFIYSLEVSPEGTVYLGTYPALFRSEDRGETWTKLIPTRKIVQLSAIKTFGSTGVLVGTAGAGLLKSTDKGNSWLRIDGNNFDTITCIGMDSKGSIAAGTNRGLWFFDIDKNSWAKVMLGTDDNLYIGGIDVSKTDDFYIGTYGSSIWMGSTHHAAVKMVSGTDSDISVFPNPASGVVKISCLSNGEQQAKLVLFDFLGRKIAVIADERFSGRKEYSLDTSHLPGGMYTIIFTANQGKEIERLIVNH